jgi:hypothetical protein
MSLSPTPPHSNIHIISQPMNRIIKLIPRNPALLIQVRRMQKILRNLPLGTSKPLPPRHLDSAIVPHLDRRDPLDGTGVLAPRIGVLVDLGRDRRDVELV